MKNQSRHLAFTLIELLVVLVLMSILAGMMSYAMAGARQEAREKRAQAEIQAMSSILLQKMNEINLQPVLYVPDFIPPNATASPHNTLVPQAGAERNRVAMLARRDLLRMTLPQCRADLIYPPARLQYRKRITAALSVACASKLKEPIEWGTMRRVAGFVTPRGVAMEGLPNISPVFSAALEDPLNGAGGYFNSSTNGTALRVALGSIVAKNGTVDVIDLTTEPWGADLSTDANSPWTREFESAECLYLILASTELYGERALDQFSSRMIANVDGDAVPEMVDPWGVPYEFIRDAAGFGFSFVNPPPAVGAVPDNPHPSGSDSNDFLRTDLRYIDDDPSVPTTLVNNPYRMTPIIVSAGSDREFGIRRSFNLDGSFTDGLAGISPRHSISVIRYQTPPGASVVPQPFLGGSYQFPDPYLAVNPIGDPGASSDGSAFIASPAVVSAATYDAWNAGVGLGARIYNGLRPVAAAADDIFSVGGPQ